VNLILLAVVALAIFTGLPVLTWSYLLINKEYSMSKLNAALAGIVGVYAAEPAVVISIVDAALMVAIAFGLPLNTDQKTAVDAFLAVLGGLMIRAKVTPVDPSPVATK
jgi:hypothetical protein